jgi:hypothetical protein
MLQEIRETIETDVTLDPNGLGIVQKRINLKGGMRHSIVQMDIFQDAVVVDAGGNPVKIEWFITPYPVMFSNMLFAPPFDDNRGPMAGSETVLMKAIFSQDFNDPFGFGTISQFPNQFLGAQPTFSFYTPALYITGLVHGTGLSTISNIAFSFYIASDNKKASTISYGLGVIRERSVAQGLDLMQQGRTIPPARNVGQTFPMWRYGGIRPERMLRGNALADFFLPYHPNDSEKAVSTANLRNFIDGARQMQGFDTAFGSLDSLKGNIPEWVRFNLSPGLVAGPIRAQQPPRKLADNGNTLMF